MSRLLHRVLGPARALRPMKRTSPLLALPDEEPRLHAALLSPAGERTGRALELVRQAVARTRSPGSDVVELLGRADWREQIVGMAALFFVPAPGDGRDHPLEALWGRIGAGSWVGPQLAATAFLADPRFRHSAEGLLIFAVEHGHWSGDRSRHKTLSALTGLVGIGAAEPGWIGDVTCHATALDLVADDPHAGRDLAWGWAADIEPLLRSLEPPRLLPAHARLSTPARWRVEQGDLLDVSADVLVCSANVELRLTGGVGGALLVRHGPSMQDELDRVLARTKRNSLPRGSIVAVPGRGTPYRAVVHAVAIDASYRTTSDVLVRAAADALGTAAALGARTVGLAALGTGFGRVPVADFAAALRPLRQRAFPPVERVVIRVPEAEKARVLQTELAAA